MAPMIGDPRRPRHGERPVILRGDPPPILAPLTHIQPPRTPGEGPGGLGGGSTASAAEAVREPPIVLDLRKLRFRHTDDKNFVRGSGERGTIAPLPGEVTGREEGALMASIKRVVEIVEVAVMTVLFGPGMSLRERSK